MNVSLALSEIEYGSKLEADYAFQLEARKRAGEIQWWGYEPVSFRLAKGAAFCPDFLILLDDGTMEAHETKGFRREAAIVRLKVAARVVPWISRFVLVTRDKLGWHFEEVRR